MSNLTEIEERVEKAEQLLRQARLNSLLPVSVDAQQSDFSTPSHDKTTYAENGPVIVHDRSCMSGYSPDTFSNNAPLSQTSFNIGDNLLQSNTLDVTGLASDTLDSTSYASDDFEWTEHHVVDAKQSKSEWSPDRSNTSENIEEEPTAMDGMAALMINDTDGSYQGASSVAAMLRLIDPRAVSMSTLREKSLTTRSDGIILNDGTCPNLLYNQPYPNRHIVDTMIDAYFGLYYRSFPLVHEPTFRALYSELIERPNGDCWKFLVYVIVAVGVFTQLMNR